LHKNEEIWVDYKFLNVLKVLSLADNSKLKKTREIRTANKIFSVSETFRLNSEPIFKKYEENPTNKILVSLISQKFNKNERN
jgi:hypothetical protein